MPQNSRSQRQMESLRRMREWHLSEAVRAKMEGRKEQADFHYRYYDLLGPAVEDGPRQG
ncbi:MULTISPECIES: hypothetical protein [unclassified Pseudomonas]|uniref:hypothetical protein n=1 Tax=unclassified Pseudomonas TaxID=196821 RepID=UPI001313E633|nr:MULTISPECIES: hypothetical protein [unclassified Pseudomonas]